MSEQENTEETQSEETEVTNPIHEDFVKSAPEELRDAALQLAPVWDSYVQQKFQEAADFRKQYEGMTPEELQDYQAFKELQQDPQKLLEWHQQWDAALHAQHPELFPEEEEWQYTEDRVDPRLNDALQRLEQQEQWIAQQESQRVLEEANTYVTSELDKIKQENPSLTEQDMDDICALASRYVPDDPSEQAPEDLLQRGFKDFQALIGRTERNLFDKKVNQPSPAQHGGRPNTSTQPITDFEQANEMAKRLVIESQKG